MPEKDGQARRLARDPLAGLDADRLKGLLGEGWARPPAPTPEERAGERKGGRRSPGIDAPDLDEEPALEIVETPRAPARKEAPPPAAEPAPPRPPPPPRPP
ncbi:MAG TPA: hypothetical protein VJP59_02260, partial [Gemmatimonadota bacterium]|nr:hypothetical protein [Gemmatimonadota bacterium]